MVGAIVALGAATQAEAKTLTFSGHRWTVRPNGVGGPRDNHWCKDNAFVDDQGRLHLKLTQRNGIWCAAEVESTDRMVFGAYQWQLDSRVDQLDRNVVFGLFQYPTADVGPDGTNEIDIEFTRWGDARNNGLNYTVYPAQAGCFETSEKRPIVLNGDWSTHRYIRTAQSVRFQSGHGHYDDNPLPIADWTYAPSDPARSISRQAMPVYMNLWIIAPPLDGQPVEMVISSFKYTSAGD